MYWATFLYGTVDVVDVVVVVVVVLWLLLCNDVDLTEEKMHGELWAFHTVLHQADNGSFNVLFFFFFLAIIS